MDSKKNNEKVDKLVDDFKSKEDKSEKVTPD